MAGLGYILLSLLSVHIPILLWFFFFFLVFLAVLGLHCCAQAFSSCSARASHCGSSLVTEYML